MTDRSLDLPAAAHQASRSLLLELKGVRSAVDEKEKGTSPVTLYVRQLAAIKGETFYTANEVAEQLGVSVQAIRKYAKQKVCGKGVAPSWVAPFGKIEVNCYTPSDVEALRTYLAKRYVVRSTSEEE